MDLDGLAALGDAEGPPELAILTDHRAWLDDPLDANGLPDQVGSLRDRHVRFVGTDGKVKVEAVTTWALLERATGRLMRVRPDVAAPFLP